MHLSAYTIIVDNYPDTGETLLYHTRTQALVKIDPPLRELLRDLSAPSHFADRVRWAHELDELHRLGIIVENKWEDTKKIVAFLGDLKYERLGHSFSATILTTMACNLKCVYCFEEPSRRNIRMTSPTCDSVIAWLRRRILEGGYRELFVTFYGGEPLLNEPAIEHIALAMASWCTNQGVVFRFMLQTNGTLMSTDRVEKYKTMGLSGVRISLDGVGEDHDRKRPLREGGGSFETIIRNIADNIDRVNIGLSVSFDRTGVNHVAKLLDYLDEKKVLHKLGKVVCSPVHEALGPAGGESTHNNCSLMNYTDAEMAQSVMEVNRLMEQKGLPVQQALPVTACPLSCTHGGITIDPAGRLYACNAMVGHEDFSVGDVLSGFNEKRRKLLNLDVGLKCPSDCTYLPVCNGGCRFMSLVEQKDIDTPYCRKEYLDRVAPEFIKREYDLRISRKGRGVPPLPGTAPSGRQPGQTSGSDARPVL